MDDLRDQMQRLAERVDTAAAPDLERARARHVRRRRTSALVVGVGLVAVVSLFAVSTLRDPAPQVADQPEPSPPAEEALTVWPPPGTSGDWQDTPEGVIKEFSYRVLGWTDPEMTLTGNGGPGLGQDLISMSMYDLRPDPCPDNARCTPPLSLVVSETRGSWSIDQVTHPQLGIGVEPGATITTSDTIPFDIEVPANVSAHVGLVAEGECWAGGAFEVGLGSGPYELDMSDVGDGDPACDGVGAGYVFAYTTDATTVPVGDPLLEAAAIEYPWLTVIPIRLRMDGGETGGVSEVETATITCGGDAGTSAPEGGFIAQRDGVHLGITALANIAGLEVDGTRYHSPGELVLPLAPGPHQVACVMSGSMPTEAVAVMVFDRLNVYVDPTLHCAGPHVTGDPITVKGPASWDDVLAWAVEPANLPSNAPPDVRTVFVGYPDGESERSIGYFSDPGAFLVARLDVVRLSEQEWTVTPVECPAT